MNYFSLLSQSAAVFLLLALAPLAARAQTAIPVSSYTLQASGGTYTEVTAAPTTPTAGDGDEGWYNGLPLGFTFVFRGQSYTTVSASTNGWLTFGQDITAPGTADNLATGGNGRRPLVAPLWDDVSTNGGGGFYYATTGTAPNRVFTAEWRQAKWVFNAAAASISFQVRLLENANRVQLVYRQEAGAVSLASGNGASIGLAGPDGDFLSLNSTGTFPTASYSTATGTLTTRPATGQTYTFSPPTRSNLAFVASLNDPASRTYQEVAGAPATRSTGGTNADDGYYNGLPLGFTFVLRGQAYTTVSASTNGWLTLGQNIPNSSSGLTDNLPSTVGAPRPLLAPLWDDLNLNQGNFYYATTGTAPNRVFTAEWRQARWDYNAVDPTISFQVRLFESSGRIWFMYRPEAGSVRNGSASIGLSDTDGYYLSLTNTGPTPTASSSTETNNLSTKPAPNQVYAFAPNGIPNGPLPVQLTAFVARRTGPAAVQLTWATASELRNAGFGVEKSADGSTWRELAFVPGAGSSAHAYAYPDATAAAAYYRLRQQDVDGPATYSPVRFVASSEAITALPTPYPNPVPRGGTVRLTGAAPTATLRLLDAQGRLVRAYPAGAMVVETAGLPAGLYLLQTGAAAQRLVVE